MRFQIQQLKTLFICLIACVMLVHAPNLLAVEKNLSSIQLDPQEVYKFGIVLGQIKQLYVKNVADKKLFADAIEGMLAGLDPHSSYLDEEELALLEETAHGKFGGLGIEVSMEEGMVVIIAPVDGSPAEKAGIKAGDIILAIDDNPLTSISLMQAIKKLRGKTGTTVSLTVINKKDGIPRTLKIKRDTIAVVSVKSKLLTPEFGYIRISQFQEDTGQKTKAAFLALKREANGNLHGVILDLRNNPGGLLDSAIDVADLFLDSKKLGKNKIIVYTEGRFKNLSEKIEATPGDISNGLPLIVLINHGSASGAEIAAGALKDHKRALIVGEHSFGKGSIQTVLPLDDKTAIKLTIALYYTPNGRSIQAEGITPDIQISDFQLGKNERPETFLSKMTEKTLDHHLKNNNYVSPPPKEKDLKAIAIEDYQLYEALQLLKSSYLLSARHKIT